MNPLTPSDHDLLASLIELDEDFAALALKTGRRLLDLYAWAAQPHIRAYIDFHREHLRHLQESASRRLLHQIVTSDKDPIERRRAATTLLRALRTPSRPAPSSRASARAVEAPAPTPPSAAAPAHPLAHDSSTNPALAALFANKPVTPEEAIAMADLMPTLIREMIGDQPPPPR